MPDASLTKLALSQAMKELLAERPLEKIRVADITERCKLNRQTFYYHFKDKYDLVHWIFYTEFLADIQGSFESFGWELIERICDYFYRNRAFYRNALSVRGQNSFTDYFDEVLHQLILSTCQEIYPNADDKHHQFYATFLADAIRVAITRWLFTGAEMEPPEFVALLRSAATGLAVHVIQEAEQEVAADGED
ncbi:MAG: TetR/AcrR family transcriptional regulator C-terminal domain-containing protein [Bacillota bacterium]|jgi:probable dihydroxyacetone kinase regulator